MELELETPVARLFDGLPRDLEHGVVLAASYGRHALTFQACIKKEADKLTPQQRKGNSQAVDAACLGELKKWVDLGALKTGNREGSPNLVDIPSLYWADYRLLANEYAIGQTIRSHSPSSEMSKGPGAGGCR